MKNINRRESPRIEIQLRCHVTSPAIWVRTAMYTENISRSGVLVAWCGDGVRIPVPAAGQIVTVEIELPANHGFGQKCIHCQGTVTRIVSGETGWSARGAARQLYGFPFLSRQAPRDGGSAAGSQLLDGVNTQMEAQTLPIRDQVAAVAGGLRLPDAHRFSVRAHGRRADPAGRRRHGLAHPHGRLDRGQPPGSHPRLVLFLQAGRRLVRVGVALRPGVRRLESAWAACARWCCSACCCCASPSRCCSAWCAASRNPVVAIVVTMWPRRPPRFTGWRGRTCSRCCSWCCSYARWNACAKAGRAWAAMPYLAVAAGRHDSLDQPARRLLRRHR